MPPDAIGHLWKNREADSSTQEVTWVPGGHRKEMFSCVLCQGSTYWKHTKFKLKTNKLEAKAMAVVVEPSRGPRSRHPGEPTKPGGPPNGGAEGGKHRKHLCDPKQRRPNLKFATFGAATLPSSVPHAGPWGVPHLRTPTNPSVTTAPLAHSPGSTSP